METQSLNALSVGRLAYLNILSLRDLPTIGRVINVFTNAINIRLVNDELIAITSRDVKSPITINIVKEPYIDFKYLVMPNVPVSVVVSSDLDYILVGNLRINIGTIVIYEGRAHIRSKTPIGIANIDINTFKYLLRRVVRLASILELSDAYVDEAISKVLTLIRNYISTTNIHISSILKNVIYEYLGLGTGFTPSFDDFVRGLISVMNTYLSSLGLEGIRLSYEVLTRKTTWVSSKLIEYVSHGFLPNYIARVIEYLWSSRVELNSLFDYFLDIMTVGHNSGFYICLGLMAGIAVIHSMRTKETYLLDLMIHELAGS